MLKLGILFHFTKRDKNVLGVKSAQARDITLPKSCLNVESACSLVIINFLIRQCVVKKIDLNRSAGAVKYHCTSTVCISVIGFNACFCFQIDRGQKLLRVANLS